jgi:hypothetical protein
MPVSNVIKIFWDPAGENSSEMLLLSFFRDMDITSEGIQFRLMKS